MATPYIFITADYELFFGTKTGTVRNCMIAPTEAVRQVLQALGIKMTLFVDILFYKKLCEEGTRYPPLLEEAALMRDQIQCLAEEGHEIALHLHPHWLDARYDGKSWVLPLRRYRLHHLDRKEDASSWETLLGCFTRSRELLETLIREKKPDPRVVTFRAGGFCLQPFGEIRKAMMLNSIFVDSSVFPGGICHTPELAFEFLNCPRSPFWRFQEDVLQEEKEGEFLEIPITAASLPYWRRMYHALLRRGGGAWVRWGDGDTMAIRDLAFRPSRWNLFTKPFSAAAVYLNYENMTWREMLYLFKKHFSRHVDEDKIPIVFLGHPKAISDRSLCELDYFLRKVQKHHHGVFTTMREFYEGLAKTESQDASYEEASVS